MHVLRLLWALGIPITSPKPKLACITGPKSVSRQVQDGVWAPLDPSWMGKWAVMEKKKKKKADNKILLYCFAIRTHNKLIFKVYFVRVVPKQVKKQSIQLMDDRYWMEELIWI
jgi:hypothetical protein